MLSSFPSIEKIRFNLPSLVSLKADQHTPGHKELVSSSNKSGAHQDDEEVLSLIQNV